MRPQGRYPGRRAARAFTLLESLSAAGILLVIVVAVTGAITAGQQNAFEANQRIAGTLAAEELLGRLLAEDFSRLASWDGYFEPVGAMTDMNDTPMPATFAAVGRAIDVHRQVEEIGEIGVTVHGYEVAVRSFDTSNRTLAEIARFVPEPSS
jgi:hypothetical protein